MSIPCKFERSILSYDEHEIILRSHHPEIYDAGLDDLKALRQRLREMRDQGAYPGTRESPCAARKGSVERRKLSWHCRASPAAQTGVRRGAQTREQGDRPHAEARCADRAYCSSAPDTGHASRRFVSSPSTDRRYGRGRYASVIEPAAADKSGSCQDRQDFTSHEECAGRSRRPQ